MTPNPRDVIVSFRSAQAGKPCRVTLTHKPTGIRVEAESGSVGQAREEAQRLLEDALSKVKS